MGTEKDKMISGLMYNPNDEELLRNRINAKNLCFQYNQTRPDNIIAKQNIINRLFRHCGKNILIEQTFHCDYGYNIEFGDNFYSNHNLVILDAAPVKFGDNVMVGPNCGFYTSEHSINSRERLSGLEYAKPITVGNNVWFGGGVSVLSDVTIGDNVVIGAGSVVTKDIPSNSVAVGNPCRVIKNTTTS